VTIASATAWVGIVSDHLVTERHDPRHCRNRDRDAEGRQEAPTLVPHDRANGLSAEDQNDDGRAHATRVARRVPGPK
jgi:hypothetical protein